MCPRSKRDVLIVIDDAAFGAARGAHHQSTEFHIDPGRALPAPLPDSYRLARSPTFLPELAMSNPQSYRRRIATVTLIGLVFSHAFSHVVAAQAGGKAKTAQEKRARDSVKIAKAAKDSGKVSRFFQSEEPLTLTLTTNLKRIKGDRGDNVPWRSATLSYAAPAPDTGTIVVPLRIKTRGIWRLKNCDFPPIFLNFTSEAAKPTVFRGLDQVKLTSSCRNNDDYERYVLQEFQLYRMQRLITPASHAVRLVRMTYADSATGKKDATRYAFIEEEALMLAARLGGRMIKIKGATPADLEPMQTGLTGVFEYMIGNTDFGIGGLHNVELLALNTGEYLPVVYDFDFSGAVNTRYATVDPLYQKWIRTVRQRLYRGFCIPADVYPKVFAVFNAKKDSIYALYRDPLGGLLPKDVVDETLKYYDEFYKTINNPRDVKSEIMDMCLGKK